MAREGGKLPGLLEEESIEASANIGCSVVLSVVMSRTSPLKGNPPPPFIVTRRGGVHEQWIVEVVVFPRIAGVQWSNTVGST